MEKIIIDGGRRLYGHAKISAAKNACLPIIASAIATCSDIFLAGAPSIRDVCVMAEIIERLGGSYSFTTNGLELHTQNIFNYCGDVEVYNKVRASLFTAGALLARFKKAFVPYPGGCNLGNRPIDIHIDGFKKLGAEVECLKEGLFIDGRNMKAGRVDLRYPSVGATVNMICAALMLDGETVISGAAREPEIADLCKFLNTCGYNVNGGGESVVKVCGVREPVCRRVTYKPICDRIEAGTFMLACLCCGGEIAFSYDCPNTLKSVTETIEKCGAKCYFFNGEFVVSVKNRPLPCNLSAGVFPAFPTDLQPQLCTALSVATGESRITDEVFPDRFCYADMLERFGARNSGRYKTILIQGVERFHEATVTAHDLRGGAALCIAALKAEGQSVVCGADIICRGYEDFCEKLRSLGAVAKEE